MKSINLKTILFLVLLVRFVSAGFAQINDKAHRDGLFVLPTIKIDGKNLEWKDKDFSVNKRTDLSYIISNDDRNLYVVIKSTDIDNCKKIMAGGITFSVKQGHQVSENITLTYPVVNQTARGNGGTMVTSFPINNAFRDAKRDSAIAVGQRKKLEGAREIKITNFRNTKDTLVSIYNGYGIKAFASIEADNSFFYELAIPLEELDMSIIRQTEFAYNVKVNGLQIPGLDNRVIVVGSSGEVSVNSNNNVTAFDTLTSSTDFSGKYTLSKRSKPK